MPAGELEHRLVRHLSGGGTIGFDEFQANALYAPGLGFYTGGGGAGRRRDFLTSPEVGPLFGAVIARALDRWWDELGRPDPFVVVDAGAGPGSLARAVLAAVPACAPALDLVLVEVGEVQWATHPPGTRSVAELPAPGSLGSGPVVVLANELLDNLPVALVERTADGWCEVRVGLAPTASHVAGGEGAGGDVAVDEGAGGAGAGAPFVEVLVPVPPEAAAWCELRAPGAPAGVWMPVQAEAGDWLRRAVALAGGGRVVVLDYARPTTMEMAARPQAEWLRTYARHGRTGSPLEDPGLHDITCDVAIDQLAAVLPPSLVRTQAEFLRAHGIDELVAEGRARWAELGLAGGLDAIAARSRASEAEALLDPTGLGGFTVLEWHPPLTPAP